MNLRALTDYEVAMEQDKEQRPLEDMLLEISERMEALARDRCVDGSFEEEDRYPLHLRRIGRLVQLGRELIEILEPKDQ